MTTAHADVIDNTAETIHSHDVIDRIALLEQRQAAADAEGEPLPDDEAAELAALIDLELQCLSRDRDAWQRGTVLVQKSELAEYEGAWLSRDEDVDFAGVAYALRVG